MSISTTNVTSSSDSVNVSVTMTNSGSVAGKETVMPFLTHPVYYPQIGQGLKLMAEDTDYVVAIEPETDCDVYNETAAANPLCATFTLSTGEYPFGSLVAVLEHKHYS
ncbi:unnamed protein product [Phytophthora fragariaefolia]|uniref:Unnamed protein product n=1 Tax=Phytophthora fragariaefolia TaxID=1490495 RepID=A0A9W6Y8I9_9STRA|nr:unnamed protein product [Phytophthora fragariaefolia]